ncbi:MAG: ATP-binding cassette domain-containing protein, partial [Bacilli bacterium]|nr:ATP-binding cassette domain-containing protein [Bacilli bacterium]
MEYIRLENITKIFGEVKANVDISLTINQGEVLSILGENGSGKTTLLNVLGGIYKPDEGKVYVRGEHAHIHSPKDAFHYGIGMVHQHYELVDAFTAIENIVLGLSKKALLELYDRYDGVKNTRRFRSASLKESAKHVLRLCELYGFVLEPNKTVHDMSIAEKQTLEIVKMLFRGVDTLILDEPTAVLTPQETRHLFDVIRNMKAAGKTVIIITHKLDEVMAISDRIAILRKGELVDVVETAKANKASLVEGMVGRAIDLNIHRSDIPTTGDRLLVEHLSVRNKEGQLALDDVSFTLHGSEILGIAGVSGAGQRELLDSISGLVRDRTGSIIFNNPKKDQPVTFFHKNL